ncbi:MAG: hypothetical protein OXG55_14590 [bacterium]|nr:hypothetical protein [bacterium]
MDADVVAAVAEQAGVLQGGLAAVAPVVDVVDLADLLGDAAADAASVAGDELFAQPRRDLAFGSSKQCLASVLVEDARQDPGVTCQRQHLGRGEGGVVGEAGVDDPLADQVVVGQHDQLCAHRRALAAGVAVADQFCERIRGALLWRGTVLGVLGAEQLVAAGQQRGAHPVSGERVELREQMEHPVALLSDRRPAAPPLGGPPRLEFLLTGGVVDHLLDRAAQLILGLDLGGVQQRPPVQRRVGGGVEDHSRRLRRDRPLGEPVGHLGRPLQLPGDLHGLAGAGTRPLLIPTQHLFDRLLALPARDLGNHLRLAGRDRRPRPPHAPQAVTQHRQGHLPQRHRRREQPLPQRRPLPTSTAAGATSGVGAGDDGVRFGGTASGEARTGTRSGLSAARLSVTATASGGVTAGDGATGAPRVLAHLAITPSFVPGPRPSAANAPCHCLSTI